jgi:hypothetical protein
VKGYIAQEIGEAIDWAAVAAAIAKELDRQVGSQRTSTTDLKSEALDFNAGCPSINGGAGCSQFTSTKFGVVSTPRMHPASQLDVLFVKEFHDFLLDL